MVVSGSAACRPSCSRRDAPPRFDPKISAPVPLSAPAVRCNVVRRRAGLTRFGDECDGRRLLVRQPESPRGVCAGRDAPGSDTDIALLPRLEPDQAVAVEGVLRKRPPVDALGRVSPAQINLNRQRAPPPDVRAGGAPRLDERPHELQLYRLPRPVRTDGGAERAPSAELEFVGNDR